MNLRLSKGSNSRRLGKTLRQLAFGATILSGVGLFLLYQWGEMGSLAEEATIIEFKPATSLKGLSDELYEKGLISNSRLFSLWVRLYSDYRLFQAGLYRFSETTSPSLIAETLTKGITYHPIVLKFTVPEGFTYRQFSERLISLGVGTKLDFQKLYNNKDLIKKNNIPSPTLEGYIYPATYEFNRKMSAKEVVEFTIKTFWEKLPPLYEEQVQQLKLSLHKAVTFASLIELETNIDTERSMVSEVIWRRLKNGEPLAIDASLIFGINDYDGDLKWRHLSDRSNRYNTRIHKGLPPSPIGSPSLLSLKAVLNPTNQGYYYYVVDYKDMTRHHFSKTLKEHNYHVRKLVELSKRKK